MYYEDAETQITEKMRLETARIPFEAVPKSTTICLTRLLFLFILLKHNYLYIKRGTQNETNLSTQEKTKKQSSRFP